MDRRKFLLAAATSVGSAGAASRASAAAQPQLPNPTGPSPQKLKIDAYSRHLQWLRTPQEVAQAAIEMTYEGLDVTVRPYPGHVDPEKVATELPAFVAGVRSTGLPVHAITAPIADADSPNAERILDTASKLGIRHYWWGTFRYDLTKPVMPQLEALKPRVEKLVRLNEKYGMKAMYHTYGNPDSVGARIWDLLEVLKNFDPRFVSFHYDTGHMTDAGGNGTWEIDFLRAGPYIGGLSIKDTRASLNIPNPQGGAFRGTAADLAPRRPGTPPPDAESLSAGAAAPRSAPPAAAAGRDIPTERGGGGKPLPWYFHRVPLGTGMIDLPRLAELIKQIDFQGPVEIQSEYPNGGADRAADKLTLPREIVLGNMKRDLLTLRAVFGPAGLVEV